jgi:hypothetical protein
MEKQETNNLGESAMVEFLTIVFVIWLCAASFSAGYAICLLQESKKVQLLIEESKKRNLELTKLATEIQYYLDGLGEITNEN